MSNSTKTIAGKVYNLRIYSKNVEHVQEMLKKKGFEEAIIDSNDSPVENTVPFLWGIIQKKDESVDESVAYGLYDTLVDEGYNAQDFCELIINICEASGFFAPARVAVMRATIAKMTDLHKATLEKLKQLPTDEKQPKQS